MRKNNFCFALVLCGIFFLIISGCTLEPVSTLPQPENKAKVSYAQIEDIDLAQALVWPKPSSFKLTRDPFKPLIGKGKLAAASRKDGMQIELYVRGIVSVGGRSFALIETPTKTKTYAEGDLVDGYIIKKIGPEKVFFKKGDKEIFAKIEGGRNRE